MGRSPKAPNPYDTAKADMQYGIGSSISSGIVNNPNIVGPSGTTTYANAGNEEVTLPDGSKVSVPRYTQTTTLGKAEQAQKDQRDQIMGSLLGTNVSKDMNQYQTGYKTNAQSTNFDTGQNTIGFMGINNPNAPKLQTSLNSKNGSGDLTKDAGTLSFTSNEGTAEERRKQYEDAYVSRGTDLLSKNRDSEVARLAAMGLAPGGENYGRVADQFERSGNDLAIQAQLAGGQEFMNLTGAENDRLNNKATLNNSAVGQGQGMDLNEANFGNNAKGQQFNMQQAQAQLQQAQIEMENARRSGDTAKYNAALQASNAAKQQMTQNNQQSAAFNNSTRQQMINELLGIVKGAQVQSPNTPNYQGQAIQSPDFAGMVNSNYQQQVGAYNNNMSGAAGILKTLLGALPIPGL